MGKQKHRDALELLLGYNIKLNLTNGAGVGYSSADSTCFPPKNTATVVVQAPPHDKLTLGWDIGMKNNLFS